MSTLRRAVIGLIAGMAAAWATSVHALSCTPFEIGAVSVEVTAEKYIAEIAFTDSSYDHTITFAFDDPGPIASDGLVISPYLLDPQDPCWDSRLPSSVFASAELPVVINVESGLSPITFNGSMSVEIASQEIDHGDESALRLLKSPTDGIFEESTASIGIGGYDLAALAGTSGDFAVAADLRPIDAVAETKYQSFQTTLTALSLDIDPAVQTNLDTLNSDSETAFSAGDANLALTKARELIEAIETAIELGLIDSDFSGVDYSGAGILLRIAHSLELSLQLADRPASLETRGREKLLVTASSLEVTTRVGFSGLQSFDLEGLTMTAADVSVSDPALLARLPADVSIADDFPVLVTISPSSRAQQAFAEQLRLSLETELLSIRGDTALRLFLAPGAASDFVDMTSELDRGSFQIASVGGLFEQALVVRDDRAVESVIAEKLTSLQTALDDATASIDAGVLGLLQTELDEADTQFLAGQARAARLAIEDLQSLVEEWAGDGIPGVWNPSEGLDNVAAELFGLAETTRFSLIQMEFPPFTAGDVDRNDAVDVQDVFTLVDEVFGG